MSPDRAPSDAGRRITEAELDSALRMLLSATAREPANLTHLRTTVLSTIDAAPAGNPAAALPLPTPAVPATARTRMCHRPQLLAAVIVLLVVCGGFAVTALFSRNNATSAAATALNQAAAAADHAAETGTDVIPAGKYRYVNINGWAASMGDHAYLQQARSQQWIPADLNDMWLERRSTTSERRWINGSEADAPALNLPPAGTITTEPDLTGPCHSYFTNLCTGEGTWSVPTLEWIANLPTDPQTLYDKLYEDSKGFGQSDEAEMLVLATEALKSNILPASTRATLYRTMAMIPGVEITDATANLDGQTGVAFAVSSPYIRDETIIDTATGDYIGTRMTALTSDGVNKIPAGTVISYTAVTKAIVDQLGDTP